MTNSHLQLLLLVPLLLILLKLTFGILRFKNRQIWDYRLFLPISIASLLFFSLVHIKYDQKQYFTGYGCVLCNIKLPYNVKPVIDGMYEVTMFSDDERPLFSVEFNFRKDEPPVKAWVEYGFNDSALIVKCIDEIDRIRYLKLYDKGSQIQNVISRIGFKEINVNEVEIVRENYKWISLNKDDILEIQSILVTSFFGILASLLLVIYLLLKLFGNIKHGVRWTLIVGLFFLVIVFFVKLFKWYQQLTS